MKVSGFLLALMLFSCSEIDGKGSVTVETPESAVLSGFNIASEAAKLPGCKQKAMDYLGVDIERVISENDWTVSIAKVIEDYTTKPKQMEGIAAFVNCEWGETRIVINRDWVEMAGPIPMGQVWLHEIMHSDRCFVEDEIELEEEEVLIEVISEQCLKEFYGEL